MTVLRGSVEEGGAVTSLRSSLQTAGSVREQTLRWLVGLLLPVRVAIVARFYAAGYM